jgi:uncharacterized protein YndB with AHSA1/START domain
MAHVEVSRLIPTTPERVYELVSDLPRMGEWSPENLGGSWIKGATGPAVGAQFKGKNRKGGKRWSTISTVVIADPGKEFAFDVSVKGFAVARWGFRLEAADGGTVATEYWDDHRSKVMAKLTGLALGIPDRAVHNTAGMEQTLEKLAAAV